MRAIDFAPTIASRVQEYSRAVGKWLEFVGGLVVVIVLCIAIAVLVFPQKNGKGT
jgi:hypothetical protein